MEEKFAGKKKKKKRRIRQQILTSSTIISGCGSMLALGFTICMEYGVRLAPVARRRYEHEVPYRR
jgi:hypothetical protein